MIQFAGLKDGLHRFTYEVGDEFFDSFEQTLVTGGNVHVTLDLDKQSDHLNLHFSFAGSMHVDCDRCLASAPFPIKGTSNLIIQLQSGDSDDADIIYLSSDAYQYNIAQYLYETLALSLPLRLVPCETSGDMSICDQEVIAKLEALSVSEPAIEEEAPTDPRWDALKKLSGDK
ncbi:MAG: DUF177 domain-containing protein [Bacteroidia bacterium]